MPKPIIEAALHWDDPRRGGGTRQDIAEVRYLGYQRVSMEIADISTSMRLVFPESMAASEYSLIKYFSIGQNNTIIVAGKLEVPIAAGTGSIPRITVNLRDLSQFRREIIDVSSFADPYPRYLYGRQDGQFQDPWAEESIRIAKREREQAEAMARKEQRVTIDVAWWNQPSVLQSFNELVAKDMAEMNKPKPKPKPKPKLAVENRRRRYSFDEDDE